MRFLVIVIMQALFLVELVIYIIIWHVLQKHDQGMKHLLSTMDLQQRKQKNVLTLSGQVISFFIEFIVSLFTLAHVLNNDMADPTVMPVVIITSSSVISMSQLWTSHESKRYIRFKLIDWKILQE